MSDSDIPEPEDLRHVDEHLETGLDQRRHDARDERHASFAGARFFDGSDDHGGAVA